MKLPTSRDIGRSSTRSGRIAPSAPSGGIGQALAGFGQDVTRVAYDLNDLRTQENRDLNAKAGYDLDLKIAEFRNQEEQAFNAAKEGSNESGIGFTRGFIEGYEGRVNGFIKENFKGVSEAQDAQSRQTLLGLGNSLYGKSYAYEQQAKTNFYDRTTNQGLDGIRTQIRNNAAPYEELKRQGLAAIDKADMPEPWKAERRAIWDGDAAESKWRWKYAANPQQAIDEIRGTGGQDAMLAAIEGVESEGFAGAESKKGASGLMQVMPETGAGIAKKLGDANFPVNGTVEEQKAYLKNPEVSRRYGESYYNEMLTRYEGDREAALVAYNGGPTRADAWLAAGRDDSVLPKETADYYKKVLDRANVQTFTSQDASSAKVALLRRTDKDASHIDGLQDGFAVKLSRLMDSAPPGIKEGLGIYSGARSVERQRELWQEALKKYGSVDEARRWVAPPGNSQHNHGNAADLGFNGQSLKNAPKEVVQWVHQNAERFGLKFPLSNENWHIEDSSTRGGKARPVDPDLDAIPYARREQLATWAESDWTRQTNEQKQQARGSIEVAVANAPAAIQNTGSYQNLMPTADQFMFAYGAEEGAQRYDQFRTSIETSEQSHRFQTMPAADIAAAVNAATPVSSGDDAALESRKYEALSRAASETIKAREADPASYAQRVFPDVAQAWVNAGTTGNYQDALAITASTQTMLGIRNPQLLPKNVATQAVASYGDPNASGADRLASVAGLVFSTPDQGQRAAIYDQLVKEGMPASMDGVFEAMARGDQGAANRLMEAITVDPAKLPNSRETTPAQITEQVYADVWAPGEIGYTAYGLSYGDAPSLERAQRGTDLMNRAVKLRMSRGDDLQAAVEGAKKDLFGDKVVFSGGGLVHADIAVDAETDQSSLVNGLFASKETFKEALARQRDALLSGKIPSEGGQRAIIDATTENRIEDIIDNGVFVQTGNGIGLRDPYTGQFVAGPDGKPLTLSMEDILRRAPETTAALQAQPTAPQSRVKRWVKPEL